MIVRSSNHSAGLVRLLVVIGTGSLIAGFLIVYGIRFLWTRAAQKEIGTRNPTRIVSWLTSSSLRGVSLPEGFRYVAAYRFPMNEQKLLVFTAAPSEASVPENPSLAFQLSGHAKPVFMIASLPSGNAEDAAVQRVLGEIQTSEGVLWTPDKIWVRGAEVEMTSLTRPGEPHVRLRALRFGNNALLITRAAAGDDAVTLSVLASALAVATDEISLVPPPLVLARDVASPDAARRSSAVAQLAALDPVPADVLASLSATLREGSPENRTAALELLAQFAQKDPMAIPPIVDQIGDPVLAKEAIQALGALGKKAGIAVGPLGRISKDWRESRSIRSAANAALVSITGRRSTSGRRKPATRRRKRR